MRSAGCVWRIVEFLRAGIGCRVWFALPVYAAKQLQMLKMEEGHHEGMKWVARRLWSGHQTDYGLNFGGKGSVLLRVCL
jgi:hypothetical protein